MTPEEAIALLKASGDYALETDYGDAIRTVVDALERAEDRISGALGYLADRSHSNGVIPRAMSILEGQPVVEYEYGMDPLYGLAPIYGGEVRIVSDKDAGELLAYVHFWEGRKAWRRVKGTEEWEELR